MKIVIDTNCLVQMLPKISDYRCLWESFLRCEFDICFTTEIIQEYEEILSRFYIQKITEFTIETLLKSPNTIQVVPHFKWHLITADYDDNKFVDCALNSGADYIVTNDKHFNVLKDIDFPPIKVIDMATFKNILRL